MNKFNVIHEIVTPESAERDDVEYQGFVVEGVSLREAIEAVEDYGCECEADSSPCARPRWLTFYKFNDGTREYHELYIPDTVTDASARRIARLMGAYGF